MKRILLLLLLTSPVWGAAPHTHAPDDWHFEITFPSEPKVAESRSSRGKVQIVDQNAHVEKDARVWGVQRITMPSPIPAERLAAAYEGGKKSMLRARAGDLIAEEVFEVGGHVGRRYRTSYNDGTRIADHRVLIVGRFLYQFIFERPANSEPDTDEEFFASIKLRLERTSPANKDADAPRDTEQR